MVTAAYIPSRGDVVWLNFTPQQGHEQAGTRPALVLSPRSYNDRSSLMLVCPITSKVKGFETEVRIAVGKINGVILADQIKSVDWRERQAQYIQKASAHDLDRTQLIIDLLLGKKA